MLRTQDQLPSPLSSSHHDSTLEAVGDSPDDFGGTFLRCFMLGFEDSCHESQVFIRLPWKFWMLCGISPNAAWIGSFDLLTRSG